MQAYFDIHSHILPGIDDGPKSMEETLHMLSIAYREGIRVILATPHYLAGNGNRSPDELLKLNQEVNEAANKADLNISIILGNELYFSEDLINDLNEGTALTIDGTRYILVEFPCAISYVELWKGLNHCIFAGYIPILSHAERYQCLRKSIEFVGELISLGAYIQLNLSSICGSKLTNPGTRFCHQLLKKEWVHFLGTDAHGVNSRSPCARKAAENIRRSFGEKRVRQLLWENPMTMLENNHL